MSHRPHHTRPRSGSPFPCAVAVLLGALGCFAAVIAQPPVAPAQVPTAEPAAQPTSQAATDPTVEFFNPASTTPIPELEIRLTNEDMQKLRDNPRGWVPCVLLENGREIGMVGVKLKGAAGSTRPVDDRPALTINTEKIDGSSVPGGKRLSYHGLQKFHLNNSVQDETLLQEWVCAEVFRAAGYPAARVAHARVSINGRDLGMYVLKEGFDRAFIKRHFGGGARDAALYDGGFLQDIDAPLERDIGKGEDDHADLQRIMAACRHADPAVRRDELDRLVDIESLLRFIAIERMLAHWDGYTHNRNNYRVYIPAPPGKARLIPHGMDQVFVDPAFPIDGDAVGVLAATVLRNPEWRSAYRAEVTKQIAAFDPVALVKKVQVVQARLQAGLKKVSAELARQQGQQARDLYRRIRLRARSMREMVAQPAPPVPPEPAPLVFKGNEARIADKWIEAAETEGAIHEEVEIGGAMWKRLACPASPERTVASWRSTVILTPGTYTLSAEASTEGVTNIPGESWPGIGAGVRVSGGIRQLGLSGSGRSTAEYTFVIDSLREVVLIMELRASAGSVSFRVDSVKLTRRPEIGPALPLPAAATR